MNSSDGTSQVSGRTVISKYESTMYSLIFRVLLQTDLGLSNPHLIRLFLALLTTGVEELSVACSS